MSEDEQSKRPDAPIFHQAWRQSIGMASIPRRGGGDPPENAIETRRVPENISPARNDSSCQMKIAHLRCPRCSKPHIDEDVWATHPHQTHRCIDDTAGRGCQQEWESDAKCISKWEPNALLVRAKKISKWRWPGRWRVGSADQTQIWAPHPDGIGGLAAERQIARINSEFGHLGDAAFIANAPQLIDALVEALAQSIQVAGHLAELSKEFAAQDLQWGGPAHDDRHTSHDWIAILASHLGKAVSYPFRLDVFRRQMVKVGGLALAGLRWADRMRDALANKGGGRS